MTTSLARRRRASARLVAVAAARRLPSRISTTSKDANGHLTEITIEFFIPGATKVAARWDFPITYDGSGVDSDMWVARELVRRTIEKAGRPPAHASYEVLLATLPGRPDVWGMGPATYRSTDGLIGRASGTAIATPDIMAGLRYWRAA